MKHFPILASVLAVSTAVQGAEQSTQNNYGEMVITASRVEQPLREVAVSMSVIDADEIELKGDSSLADLLRTEPGISVSNNGGQGQVTAVRIRGEEQYRTLLLVDGIDVSDPSATQHGPLFENFVTGGDIERVEILRGPQGFIYGADAGGVVNVISRDGSDGLGASLQAEAGSYGTRNLGATLTAGDETANAMLSVSDYETDGFNARVSDTELADEDGSSNTTLHFKGKWQPNDGFGATLVYRDTSMDYDYDACYHPVDFSLENDCSGENDQQNLKLTLDYDLGRWQQSFSFATTDIKRSAYTQDELSYVYEGGIDTFGFLGQLDVTDGQRWLIGTDIREIEMNSSYGYEGERGQKALFTEYQWQPLEPLYLTAGVRFDDHDDFGGNNSGRISAAWLQETDNLTLKYRASYGTGFRAPSLFELAYNAGPYQFGTLEGVQLEEERSKGYDLGVDLTLASGLQLELTYFDQQIENQIYYEFDLLTYYDGYRQDEGESQSEGVELSLVWPIVQQLSVQASATYNETEDSDGEQRVRRPRNVGSLALLWNSRDERLSLLLAGRYAYDAVDSGGVELDDYELVDLSVRYRATDNLELFGRIDNLTEEEYTEVSGYRSADRAGYAGVRVSF